jgi:hypothetical protein
MNAESTGLCVLLRVRDAPATKFSDDPYNLRSGGNQRSAMGLAIKIARSLSLTIPVTYLLEQSLVGSMHPPNKGYARNVRVCACPAHAVPSKSRGVWRRRIIFSRRVPSVLSRSQIFRAPHTRPGLGICRIDRDGRKRNRGGTLPRGRPTSGGHSDRPVGLAPWRSLVGLVPRTSVP